MAKILHSEYLNPYERGFEDRRKGLGLKDNPYKSEGEVTHYSQNGHKWERGFYDAHYQILDGTEHERIH